MCTSPIYKKNPYFGATDMRHAINHNVEDEYLACPCGHCAECRAVKQSNMIQRMQSESKYNHIFFATLTYDNKHLPVLEVEVPLDETPSSCEEVADSASRKLLSDPSLEQLDGPELFERIESSLEAAVSDMDKPANFFKVVESRDKRGRVRKHVEVIRGPESEPLLNPDVKTKTISIRYADIHHLQLMFKRMRDNNTIGRGFRYLAVSERGKANGRPHFHILFLIPKFKGDNFNTCLEIESKLKDMLLEYWSTNVGTRKFPVYERNFTYRQRWIGRRLYRNFDCHYVNPNLTTDGCSNVAFYVTKYIYKDSPKEQALQRMLAMNITDKVFYNSIWDIVKSRYVASKGLGLDGCMFTVLKPVYVPVFTTQLKRVPVVYRPTDEDLPPDMGFKFETTVNGYRIDYVRSRVLVPNPELEDILKKNAMLEPEKGFGIFVGYNGKHLPLGRYYRERILGEYEKTILYLEYDPVKYPPKRKADELSKEEIERIEADYARRIKQIDAHEVLDSRWDDIEDHGQSIDPYVECQKHSAAYIFTNNLKTVKTWN